jgi:hypothetical protein
MVQNQSCVSSINHNIGKCILQLHRSILLSLKCIILYNEVLQNFYLIRYMVRNVNILAQLYSYLSKILSHADKMSVPQKLHQIIKNKAV